MKILVSGGTGFAGRFIVEALAAAAHEIVVGGRRRPEPGFFGKPVAFVALTLDPARDQTQAFSGIDAFVHAAFDHLPGRYRGGEGDDPEGFQLRNLDGSVALFRQAAEAGVGKIALLSSRAVYGTPAPGVLLDETMKPEPDTLYGRVKLEAEGALAALAGPRVATLNLRATGVYGPAGPGREDKWTPLIREHLAGRAVAQRAGTEVHGADLAAAAKSFLEAEGKWPAAVNVSDIAVDTRAILATAQSALGLELPLPPAGDIAALNAMNTERLRALGWRPGGMALFRETVAALARAVDRSD